jgi:hypothetical protein
MTTRVIPRTGRLYIQAIQILGLAFLITALYQGIREADPKWLILALLTALVSAFSVRVSRGGTPSGSVVVSVADFFIFAALVTLGPAAAVVMAATEGLVASWRENVASFDKTLFNVSQLSVSAALVGFLYQGSVAQAVILGSSQTWLQILHVLVLSALVYFLLNSLLVVLAMVLVSRISFLEVVRKGFLCALPTNGMNACLVVLVLSLSDSVTPVLALVLVPLIPLAYLFRRWSATSFGRREITEESKRDFGLLGTRFFQGPLPAWAKSYVLGIVVLALPVGVFSWTAALGQATNSWLYLAGLAALASCFPIRLFSLNQRLWLTLGDVFVFAAIFQFGPEVAVVVATVEAVVFNLRSKAKPAYRWLFNVGQLVVAAFLVGQGFRLVAATGAGLQLASPGLGTILVLLGAPMACGILYYLLTFGLAAAAVALSSGQRLRDLWRRNLLWSSASVLGALLGAVGYLLLGGLGF